MSNIAYLSGIDISIIVAYALLSIGVGVYLAPKASQSLAAYFLGERTIPWWAIGASGTASNFDMAGTMTVVSFFFAIGLQGFWVALRGGMALYMSILMVYMGKWLQRSPVMTTAEWMEFRFGSGRSGKVARLLSAIANLLVTLALLVYFVKGGGKFLAVYFPFNPTVCALLLVGVAVTYTSISGFYGTIYTDVIQEILILSTSIYIGYRAFTLSDRAEVVASASYPGWDSFLPRWEAAPMTWLENPALYQAFGLCIIFWAARSLFEGTGGFTGGYTPQRYYAARNEREAGLFTTQWILLLLFRWILVVGTALLGLHLAYADPGIAALLASDPEQTLPVVLARAIPSGVRGVLVVGLIAAAMSTFDSTINAGVSYWIRDIYQLYLAPEASEKQLVRQSYLATVALAAIAVFLSQSVPNVNAIWSWITGSLAAGLAAPIVLRWYWWRFNGYGFAIATAVGAIASVIFRLVWPDVPFYLSFSLVLGISFLAGVLGAYATQPTDMETLAAFWLRVRPFGIWGAVTQKVDAALVRESQRENTNDVINVFAAIAWQLSGVVFAIAFLLHKWPEAIASALAFALFSLWLYCRWYRNLPPASPFPGAIAAPSNSGESGNGAA